MIRLKPGAKQRIEACQKKHLCLACKRPLSQLKGRVIRGVHESCRKVISRYYDEDQMISEGKLLPSKSGRTRFIE